MCTHIVDSSNFKKTSMHQIEICPQLNVTESVKTGLICTKYTYSFYHIYLFFCVGYTISVSFIKFLRKFCVFDEFFDKVLC